MTKSSLAFILALLFCLALSSPIHPKPTPVTSTPTSTPPSFAFPTQSQWGPDDISTVVFGCIASILAVLGLLLTIWFSRRRPSLFTRAGDADTQSSVFEMQAVVERDAGLQMDGMQNSSVTVNEQRQDSLDTAAEDGRASLFTRAGDADTQSSVFGMQAVVEGEAGLQMDGMQNSSVTVNEQRQDSLDTAAENGRAMV